MNKLMNDVRKEVDKINTDFEKGLEESFNNSIKNMNKCIKQGCALQESIDEYEKVYTRFCSSNYFLNQKLKNLFKKIR